LPQLGKESPESLRALRGMTEGADALSAGMTICQRKWLIAGNACTTNLAQIVIFFTDSMDKALTFFN